MDESEKDPLKELFQSLPEIEPSGDLRRRILEAIEEPRNASEVWVLKPALALASVAVVWFLGILLSWGVINQKRLDSQVSPIQRWAQGDQNHSFLRDVKDF